jgi:hypothetical protein
MTMRKLALSAALAAGVLTGPAFAQQPQDQQKGYPAGGLGDAWFQNQPSTAGINNGYDPQAQTYTVPGTPPYTVPADPRRANSPRY